MWFTVILIIGIFLFITGIAKDSSTLAGFGAVCFAFVLFIWLMACVLLEPNSWYHYQVEEVKTEIVGSYYDEKLKCEFRVSDSGNVLQRDIYSEDFSEVDVTERVIKEYYNLEGLNKYYFVRYSTKSGPFIPWIINEWVIIVERR